MAALGFRALLSRVGIVTSHSGRFRLSCSRRTALGIRLFGSQSQRVTKLQLLLPLPILWAAEMAQSKSQPLTASQLQILIQKADQFYKENAFKELYDLLVIYKDDGEPELLWRLARASFELGKLCKNKEEEKKVNLEAFDYIQKALALGENNFAVHKWMFILLDKASSYEGLKHRISKSFEVKRHIQRACELNPNDGTSWHLLGYWCFSVADLPWYQRKIAATLFAAPPESTFEEALQYFLKAEEAEPNFYSANLLLIGKSYLRLGDRDNAISYLQRAKVYLPHTNEDLEVKNEAAQLLKSMGVN